MALSTISNGESGLSARTKINTAFAAIDALGAATSGTSGTSGASGASGTSGSSGTSGTSGVSGSSGSSGTSGQSPTALGQIGLTVDGGGSAITTGSKGYVYVPYNATITGWEIYGDASGSIVIDVKKSTYAAFSFSSIAGTEKPTLSSAQKNRDQSLTTWTTSLTQGDILNFVVDSASTVTRVNLAIYVTKN